MEGHWRSDSFEAIYTSAEGGLILSISKWYDDNGAATLGEFERFAIEGDAVVLTPFPGGKERVGFRLVSNDADAECALFSNPDHDWPTTLLYERPHFDELHIRVSGPGENGEERALEFHLKRMP